MSCGELLLESHRFYIENAHAKKQKIEVSAYEWNK